MPRNTPRPLTVVLTVVVGALMIPVDATIVNVALTKLAQATGATLPVIQWVSTGYALALAAVLPTAAWLIARFGARDVFLGAIGLFAVGSALVAASWDVESLIAFRVLQGAAGGVVMPATMTLVLGSSPPEERGRMMAVLGLPIMLGPILAPVLGGWLLDTFSWQWMFLINVPLGLVAVALGLRNLPALPAGPRPPMDWLGLALLPPAMALLVLATSKLEPGSIPPAASVMFVAGGLLITTFAVHAVRTAWPLLDLRLLAERVTGGTTAILVLYSAASMAALILMPLFWQVQHGESALRTGLFMAPGAVAAAAVIKTGGRLIDTTRPLIVIGSGIALTAAAHAGLAIAAAHHAPPWIVVTAWAAASVGSAITVMPATTTATRHLRPAQVPSGTTLIQVTAQIAASISVAVVSVLLASRLDTHLPGEATIGSIVSLPAAEHSAIAPQVGAAFSDAFWLPAILCAAAGLLATAVLRDQPAPNPRAENRPSQSAPTS